MMALLNPQQESAGGRPPARGAVFVMAGGGTGGHVIPALAVAESLRERGHSPLFIGTRRGLEAKLVPGRGFPLEWIEISGLLGQGIPGLLRLLVQLPRSVVRVYRLMGEVKPAAVFSMGGYVAGPVMLAAILRRIPIVAMEPNAMPGFTTRKLGRLLRKALVSFPEAVPYFPPGVAELSGLPVRPEFFACPRKTRQGKLTVLLTGGSQGSRKLNEAARDCWEIWRNRPPAVRLIHQSGPAMFEQLRLVFAASGLDGEVVAFLDDMAAAFAEADLVISRSGAGTVAELAAAGRPALLVSFPFAADDHQRKNAEAMQRAGAARLIAEQEWTGRKMAAEIEALLQSPAELDRMAAAARALARPDAARRAVQILESLAAEQPRNIAQR